MFECMEAGLTSDDLLGLRVACSDKAVLLTASLTLEAWWGEAETAFAQAELAPPAQMRVLNEDLDPRPEELDELVRVLAKELARQAIRLRARDAD